MEPIRYLPDAGKDRLATHVFDHLCAIGPVDYVSGFLDSLYRIVDAEIAAALQEAKASLLQPAKN